MTGDPLAEKAQEIALAAVGPLEGHPLAFSAALEMAATNVAARIRPLLLAFAHEVRERERERLHTLLERCHAAINPEDWPAVVEAVCAEFDTCNGSCGQVRALSGDPKGPEQERHE